MRHASAVRTPPDAEIYAPEFAPRMDWLNVAFLRIDKLLGRHAVPFSGRRVRVVRIANDLAEYESHAYR